MNHPLDHGLSETIEYLTNFSRKCLMGKRVDVSEQLEEIFANLASFQTFFFKFFCYIAALFLLRTYVERWRYGREEIRRAEMRSQKVEWKSWKVFLRETMMQVPCLTNIVKGLVLLMIFSSKMFELFLWPSRVLFCCLWNFDCRRSILWSCFNWFLAYIWDGLYMQKINFFQAANVRKNQVLSIEIWESDLRWSDLRWCVLLS